MHQRRERFNPAVVVTLSVLDNRGVHSELPASVSSVSFPIDCKRQTRRAKRLRRKSLTSPKNYNGR